MATGEVTRDAAEKKRNLPPEFLERIWKPGQSGNPNGRPKKLSDELGRFLDRKVPNDPQKRNYYHLLIEAFVKRAITKSDVLVKEIFDRIEGRVAPNEEEALGKIGVEVVVLDIPRPDRSTINVTPAAPGNKPLPPGNKPDPRPEH